MCVCAVPTTPFEGVTVYGRRQAADYQEVRRFFEDRGVVFDLADIECDPTSLQRMVQLSGQQEAVVIEIGQNIFVGLNPQALDRVLP
ncbi:MAG: glutaredoxin family protein [Anaerolineae bacterium]|nr:glutaredoxin family protein [Anaerolineae bacterium]